MFPAIVFCCVSLFLEIYCVLCVSCNCVLLCVTVSCVLLCFLRLTVFCCVLLCCLLCACHQRSVSAHAQFVWGGPCYFI